VGALSKDKDPHVRQHARRIHMIIQGGTAGDAARANEEVGFRHEADES
jgi:hypothetical protein